MKIKKLAALILAGALCVSIFTGCGVNPQEAAAVLGDQTVTYELANFACKYQKATADDMYSIYAQYYKVDSLWDVDLTGSGTTMAQQLKSNIMEMFHEFYTLKAHMSDYNIAITEEDEAAIKAAAAAFMEANSAEAIEEFGASEEVAAELLTLYTIQSKMYNAITADVDRVVSDDEANMRGYSIISVGLSGEYNSSGSYVKYTEAQLAEIKANADKMETALKSADMDTVAEEYGYKVTTGAYAKEDKSLDEALITAMDALKEGEVSGKIETDTAIYFVRIDADTDKEATEQNRESIIAEREYAKYEEVLTGWQKEDGWKVNENVIEKIDFHHIFTQTSESTEKESDSTQSQGTETTNSEETEETQTTESN